MIGMGVLKGLLSATPASAPVATGRVSADVDPIVGAAIRTVQRVAIETLAMIGDAALVKAARSTISRGQDILWIGVATKDVRISPLGFTVLAKIRFEGEAEQRSVMFASDGNHRITSVVHTDSNETIEGIEA